MPIANGNGTKDHGVTMTDLTDSYCERCGAHYVFSPPTPKSMSLKGAKVLAKGLKNFVLTDGQSMADAMTLARHEDSHLDATRITEAFHETFNFCMNCRQYACVNCWNAVAGACLSCSPQPGHGPLESDDGLDAQPAGSHWDTDWSSFLKGPVAESTDNAEPPLPFNAPIRFSDEAPAEPASSPPAQGKLERTAPSLSPHQPQAAWPKADLPAEPSMAPDGTDAKPATRSTTRPVDPQTAMLWPITDELAPEMMLTAEELRVVEDGLHHAEPALPGPVVVPTAAQVEPVQPVLEPAVELAVAETAQTEPETADPADAWSTVATPNPGAASAGHEAMLAAMSAAERPAPDRETADAGRQSHDPWPRVTAWPRRPSLAHAPAPDAAALRAPQPNSVATPAAAPAPEAVAAQLRGDPALAPTTPAITSPAPATVARQPGGGPSAASQTNEPAAPSIDPSTVDARHSAALRLTAVPADESPAAIRDPQSWDAPASSAAVPPAPQPSPRSPLGSKWPPKDDPNAPWPMPPARDVPSVLSAVAASRQQGPLNLSEMWTQSAQEVINRGTVRVCRNCSLPVSTQAKFCRRCGTQQA